MTLGQFRVKYCGGKGFGSCLESPCRYATERGCQHPLHPGCSDIDHYHQVSAAIILSSASGIRETVEGVQ